MIKVVKNLVRLNRLEKELTQEELAEIVGVTRQTIGLIEKGHYNPTITLCLNLSRVLGKGLDHLFWMEETENEKR